MTLDELWRELLLPYDAWIERHVVPFMSMVVLWIIDVLSYKQKDG